MIYLVSGLLQLVLVLALLRIVRLAAAGAAARAPGRTRCVTSAHPPRTRAVGPWRTARRAVSLDQRRGG